MQTDSSDDKYKCAHDSDGMVVIALETLLGGLRKAHLDTGQPISPTLADSGKFHLHRLGPGRIRLVRRQ